MLLVMGCRSWVRLGKCLFHSSRCRSKFLSFLSLPFWVCRHIVLCQYHVFFLLELFFSVICRCFLVMFFEEAAEKTYKNYSLYYRAYLLPISQNSLYLSILVCFPYFIDVNVFVEED